MLESTGFFADRRAQAHIDAGARKVVISAPAKDPDVTLVLGVNEDVYDADAAPPDLDGVLHHELPRAGRARAARRVRHRVGPDDDDHAYTNDQKILDAPHSDLRRARSAAVSIIPTSTGAASAIGLVIPEMKGKLDGFAMRVPVPDGSVVDLDRAQLSREASVDEINAALRRTPTRAALKGILAYTEDPIVSHDIVGNPFSSIVDSQLTMAQRHASPRSSPGTTTSGASRTAWSTSSGGCEATRASFDVASRCEGGACSCAPTSTSRSPTA